MIPQDLYGRFEYDVLIPASLEASQIYHGDQGIPNLSGNRDAGNSYVCVHDYRQPASLFHLFRAVGSSIGLCYSAHQKIKRTKELTTPISQTPGLSNEMYHALAEVDVIRSFFF